MRSDSTTQFVTAVKLQELRAQRRQLCEAYDRLAALVELAADPYQRLRHLYRGLEGLTYAGRKVHPELADLQILANDSLPYQAFSLDVVQRWSERLADELTAGRLRAEFVYRFGALLEQWAASAGGAHPAPPPARLHQLREQIVTSPAPNNHRDLIENLLAGIGSPGGRADTAERADSNALWMILRGLEEDQYQPAHLRAEAHRFIQDDTLSAELADALTLLGTHPDALRWPDGGVATRAVWTRNKWRLYTEQNLPTTCLLDLLAYRWERKVSDMIGGGQREKVEDRRYRLDRLKALKAPQIIIDHERRLLAEAESQQRAAGGFLSTAEPGDIWDPQSLLPHATADTIDDNLPHPSSVLAQRRRLLTELHEVGMGGYYGQDMFVPVIGMVNAEIKLARAAFPDRPVYVVKLDVRDYYPSLPHDLLLTILRAIGAPDLEVDLVARFLAMPLAATANASETTGLQSGGQRCRTAARGIPMGYRLSALLAELVGRCMEAYVQKRTPVRIIRVVDDVCLLTPDPQAAIAALGHVTSFYQECGLALNEDKFGAVCIGGELPAALDGPLPRWGMLTLDERGEWSVADKIFQQHLAQSRQNFTAATSVLSKVDIVNTDLLHLAHALALGTDLGDQHRTAANTAMTRFVEEYFGPGQGIVARLCEDIVNLAGNPSDDDQVIPAVPEAWLYWPVTAGGLGLRNPNVLAGQYAEALRKRRGRIPAPQGSTELGWNTRDNQWARYFRQLLEPLEPSAPTVPAATKSLVQDFITRGSTLSQGAQTTLTPYWRWILSIYGPEIRERFGTFRFLNTELVPLQLLGARRTARGATMDEAPF